MKLYQIISTLIFSFLFSQNSLAGLYDNSPSNGFNDSFGSPSTMMGGGLGFDSPEENEEPLLEEVIGYGRKFDRPDFESYFTQSITPDQIREMGHASLDAYFDINNWNNIELEVEQSCASAEEVANHITSYSYPSSEVAVTIIQTSTQSLENSYENIEIDFYIYLSENMPHFASAIDEGQLSTRDILNQAIREIGGEAEMGLSGQLLMAALSSGDIESSDVEALEDAMAKIMRTVIRAMNDLCS